MTELIKYGAACRALAEAVAVGDVADMRNKAEAMRHHALQAGGKGLEIQAAQIRFRAERRLGGLLIAAKNAGQIAVGNPQLQASNCSDGEQLESGSPRLRVTLELAGIDRKLWSKSQKVAAGNAGEFQTALARHAEEMRSRQGRIARLGGGLGEAPAIGPSRPASKYRAPRLRLSEISARQLVKLTSWSDTLLGFASCDRASPRSANCGISAVRQCRRGIRQYAWVPLEIPAYASNSNPDYFLVAHL